MPVVTVQVVVVFPVLEWDRRNYGRVFRNVVMKTIVRVVVVMVVIVVVMYNDIININAH